MRGVPKKMKTKKDKIHQMSARYPCAIEWSEEDGCFVGNAPPLVSQCCHGDSVAEVAKQLAAVVEDLVEDVIDGKLPAPKSPPAKNFSGTFVVRLAPGLHKKSALLAQARGDSLNQFVSDVLARA